jgi:hypothetical protein
MKLEPERGYVTYIKGRAELKPQSKERRKMGGGLWPDKGKI